jgi:uncharacterized protein YcbK (DUF882 family)|tara:strand:+ start:2147 stop:2518 length:372 start_codon:yes stop_codon:yes gene_type:complete
MQLTKNFSLSEFACNDGSITPPPVIDKLKILAKNLEVLREYLDKPIKVNSGYRSPLYNIRIGGAKTSQHLFGKASDIVVDGYTPKQVFDAIETLQARGQMAIGGLKAYGTFTHYDIRGHVARW